MIYMVFMTIWRNIMSFFSSMQYLLHIRFSYECGFIDDTRMLIGIASHLNEKFSYFFDNTSLC